jgi:type VI secretion system protein ImpH
MGRTERNAASDLIGRLESSRTGASFFQIVRLFNRAARAHGGPGAAGVGALRPRDEPVRFRAAGGMRHPAVEIAKAELVEDRPTPELTVSFVGLTGPMGTLPDHYTEFLTEQAHARNGAARDFFDLFNHRVISFFYRVWAKYRLPVRFEEAPARFEDPFSRVLAAVAGFGLDADRATLRARHGDLLGVAGALSRRVRSADGLQRIIAGLFELPVAIVEFQGRWFPIPEAERTRIGAGAAAARFGALGRTAVVGMQIFDVQSRFQIRLGPLSYEDFKSLLAPSPRARSLYEAVRLSVGPARDFDFRLILKKEDVPMMRLGGHEEAPRLGQTSWLSSRPPERDRDDAQVTARAAQR